MEADLRWQWYKPVSTKDDGSENNGPGARYGTAAPDCDCTVRLRLFSSEACVTGACCRLQALACCWGLYSPAWLREGTWVCSPSRHILPQSHMHSHALAWHHIRTPRADLELRTDQQGYAEDVSLDTHCTARSTSLLLKPSFSATPLQRILAPRLVWL